MRVNVRCCCQPEKILGTLEVPGLKQPGTVAVRLRSAAPFSTHEVTGIAMLTDVEHIELREFNNYGLKELAVYSEERPVEFWRKLSTFREGDRVKG